MIKILEEALKVCDNEKFRLWVEEYPKENQHLECDLARIHIEYLVKVCTAGKYIGKAIEAWKIYAAQAAIRFLKTRDPYYLAEFLKYQTLVKKYHD